MAITNYSELQTAVTNWMARSDIAGSAAEFIALAEARLNRELDPVETDATLSGTIGSRRIDISALPVVAPIALFVLDNGDEVQVAPKADGTFPYIDDLGRPQFWSVDGTNIDFDCPLDQTYAFRFRYQGRFALSVAAPTNWLLTNHPDVYLAAVIVWSGAFVRATNTIMLFKGLLNEGIPSVRRVLSRAKRADLSIDPTLLRRYG